MTATPGSETASLRPLKQKKNGTSLSRATNIFIACCAGWYVMELEILGGRILSIYFGSSIYVVWGSVIGVFLLSLSGGYLLGGLLSHSQRTGYFLSLHLGIAALWIVLIIHIREKVCNGIFGFITDERWGALLAALLLFAVPTIFLGTISPLIIRRLTNHVHRSGISAGMVFCFSTVASFAGCVITAFYFIRYSLTTVFYVSAGFLFLVSLAILAWELIVRKHRMQVGRDG